jgi:chemotaxis signal transduction protein
MADDLGGTAPAALVAGDAVFALPAGTRAVASPRVVRSLPGGPPELLGLALEAGRAVLVWAFDPAPAVWVLVETANGPMVLGGAAGLSTPPPGAPGVVLPSLAAMSAAKEPSPPASAESPTFSRGSPGSEAAPLRASVRPQTLALHHGADAVTVPLSVLDGLRPMPAESSPVPGAPACVLGYAETVDGPVLLLDSAWCAGKTPTAGPPPGFIAVLRQAGRRLGVPCARAEPGAAGVELASRLFGTPDGRRAFGLAPSARDVPPRPAEARRSVLLCRAAGLTFAVAAEEVAAVMPQQRFAPAPADAGATVRGVCAHRGEVLPVLDAAERLGPAPAGVDGEAPLLRLVLPHPVALAVTQILGLRSIAVDALAPVPGNPLVSALAMLDGRPVPVCCAAGLAGAPA